MQFRIWTIRVVTSALTIFIFGGQLSLAQASDDKLVATKFSPTMDISLGVFGELTQSRIPISTEETPSGIYTTQKSQSASAAPGVLGTFHQQFTPWLGYNVNLGYTRFTENYSLGTTFIPSSSSAGKPDASLSKGSIGTNMFETTIALVAQGPRNNRFSTFAQFGGGGLFFLPYTDVDVYNQETRPAMVFGVGMNYRFSEHFGMRAEYRGLFYKSPDFAFSRNIVPVTRLFTISNEPTISLTYTFSAHKKDHK